MLQYVLYPQEDHMAPLLEICLSGVESAVAAQEGGAHRIELCENLFEGGTTPSHGIIAMVKDQLSIDVHVIVRPRGGDSCYSALEYETMLRDIHVIQKLGVEGVVIGILRPDGSIDEARSSRLIDEARPMRVTFHRAFDQTRDPYEALDVLMRLGVERVLTSGQAPSAWEGREVLARLNRQAGDEITVMAGGGITATNVGKIIEFCDVREVHVGSFCETFVESEMDYRKAAVPMSREGIGGDYSMRRTSSVLVREMLNALETN
jgi:copper homeostasis protein